VEYELTQFEETQNTIRQLAPASNISVLPMTHSKDDQSTLSTDRGTQIESNE
jgi:hypothetical protein